MTTIEDVRGFFDSLDYKVIIAADGETRAHKRKDSRIVEQTPAGGVAVAFDTICQAAHALYIGRGKTSEDREVVGPDDKVPISGENGAYTLKRLFLPPETEEKYYAGFANQTLWPLCHIAFERPIFDKDWYEGYIEVNRAFAESIQNEIDDRTLVWINDYQLALVPAFLRKREDTIVSLFWHIPWPTWEIFRILPQKREILESFLCCDFVGFHRRYQARNFLNAVDQELGARIDYETNTVQVDSRRVRVGSVPMGIDVDVIRSALAPETHQQTLLEAVRSSFWFLNSPQEPASPESDALTSLCERYEILLGVDRLDYTKGINERLMGLDRFFEQNPTYHEKTVYIGIMSPTRNSIPAYQRLRAEVEDLANQINEKYRTDCWEPLHMVFDGHTREDVLDLYQRASVCLITPLDDGMNLVSKEFIVAASSSSEPGMLVLSQFAGSATDLSAALLVNPYDPDAIAAAVRMALEMEPAEKKERVFHMASLLEERDVYSWAMSFVRSAFDAGRAQQLEVVQIP